MITGEETRGRQAIGQILLFFYQMAFEASAENTQVIFAGDQAVFERYLAGTHTGEFAGMSATGNIVRVPMCLISL